MLTNSTHFRIFNWWEFNPELVVAELVENGHTSYMQIITPTKCVCNHEPAGCQNPVTAKDGKRNEMTLFYGYNQ